MLTLSLPFAAGTPAENLFSSAHAADILSESYQGEYQHYFTDFTFGQIWIDLFRKQLKVLSHQSHLRRSSQEEYRFLDFIFPYFNGNATGKYTTESKIISETEKAMENQQKRRYYPEYGTLI